MGRGLCECLPLFLIPSTVYIYLFFHLIFYLYIVYIYTYIYIYTSYNIPTARVILVQKYERNQASRRRVFYLSVSTSDWLFLLSLYIYIYTYISIYLYIFIYLYLFIFYLYNLPIWPRCLSVQLCVAVRCNVSFLSTTMMGPGWSLVVSILFSYAYNYVYRVYVWCHMYYTVSFWNCLLLQSINSVFCRRIYDIYIIKYII